MPQRILTSGSQRGCMPVEPKRNDTGHHPNREKQLAHGNQGGQGGVAMKEGPTPEPRAYEGPEETGQQRRG